MTNLNNELTTIVFVEQVKYLLITRIAIENKVNFRVLITVGSYFFSSYFYENSLICEPTGRLISCPTKRLQTAFLTV